MATKRQLIDRWKTTAGRIAKRRVIDALGGKGDIGEILANLPFSSEVEPGKDLRGIDMRDEEENVLIKEGLNSEGLRLEYSQIDVPTIRDVCFRRANFTSAFFNETDCFECDFSYAVLQRADLRRVNCWDSICVEADFTGARLNKADFKRADCRGAIFDTCDLTDAIFRATRLQGASFKGAKLIRTDLSGAKLGDCDFTDAIFEGVDMKHVDLSRAKISKEILKKNENYDRPASTLDQLILGVEDEWEEVDKNSVLAVLRDLRKELGKFNDGDKVIAEALRRVKAIRESAWEDLFKIVVGNIKG